MATDASEVFNGFPAEGIKFLTDLGINNNRDWFTEHKPIYQEFVQEPSVRLVVALGEELSRLFPRIVYDTRTNGAGSLMRIYRDVRFSADKSPYKTAVAMMFSSPGGKKMGHPGFGLQLTSEQVSLVAGVFGFDKDALSRYRTVIEQNNDAADEATAAIAAVEQHDGYAVEGKTYKRVPRGVDPEHRNSELLLYSGLRAFSPAIPVNVATKPDLVPVVIDHFKVMAPVEQWLEKWVYPE